MKSVELLFEQRAERGTERGADRVLADARDAGSRNSITAVASADDLTIDDLQPRPVDDRRSRGRHRWLGVAAAVAATIAVVVAMIAVADGDGGDVATDRAPTQSVPDSAAPPDDAGSGGSSTVIDPLGYRWSRIPHEDAVFGDRVPFTSGMNDVTVGGPGLVAVGEGDGGATVWTSVDGISWSRVPLDDAVAGGHGTQIIDVTVGGPGLVAVGSVQSADGGGEAVVWTSTDGLSWSRVPHDEAVFGEGHPEMKSVVAGGPGLVAVGSAGRGWDLEADQDAVVWTSEDGLSWSRVPHDEAVFGGTSEVSMQSVTVGGPGLVAVGSAGFLAVDRGQNGDLHDFTGVAAVWTSVDGLKWSRVPRNEVVFGGEGNQWMDDVSVAGSGLVAVGGDWSSDAHSAAVWTSVDGITWTRVSDDEAVFGGGHDQVMHSVTTAGSGLVAVGRAFDEAGNDSAASVWTSNDGVTWSWLGYDEAVFGALENPWIQLSEGPVFTENRQLMNTVIATDLGVVAVGTDWSGFSHGAAVWVATPEAVTG